MTHLTRRNFLRTSLGAAAMAAAVPEAARAAKRSATDWVKLGNTNVKVTRLAFGTGSRGGSVQRAMGQEAFTRMVRHAYDRGVRFFETADAYTGMPQMLGEALKGIPRDSYRLMTKYRLNDTADPQASIDRFRKELKTEYFDILLLHCLRTATWTDDHKRLQDALSEAKSKKVILAHGASCHGLLPLRTLSANNWLDVALIRVNHKGTRMDTLSQRDTNDLGDVKEVSGHAKAIHGHGIGVLGMKLAGEGQFTAREDRQQALKFAMNLGAVDAVTIGYKSPEEVDEAIENLNLALA